MEEDKDVFGNTVNQNIVNEKSAPQLTKEGPHQAMPAGLALSTNLSRLGVILSNYAILGLIIMCSTFMFFILYACFYIVLIFLTIATLGLIYVIAPGFSSLWNVGDNFEGILNFINTTLPFVIPATLICAVASLVLLCLNKENRSIPRIVFASILIGLTVIFGIGIIVSSMG